MRQFAVFFLVMLGVTGQQQMLAGQAAAAQGTSLFNGQTLEGWEPRGDAVWVVENGYITATPSSGNGFLATTGDYGNYRIQAEFWADSTANGGIYLRVPAMGPGVNPSIEVNISDGHAQWPTGSIASVVKYENPRTVGRWASFDITIRGDAVTVLLDGQQVAQGQISRPPTGRIALQKLGGGVIRYRNIRVTPL